MRKIIKTAKNLDKNTLKILLKEGLITVEQLEQLSQSENTNGEFVSVLESVQAFYENLKQTSSIHTANGYKANIMSYIEFMYKTTSLTTLKRTEIKEGDVSLVKASEWMEHLASEGYDSSSIKRYMYALRSYYLFLSEMYGLPKVDVAVLEIPTQETVDVNVLKHDEVIELANHALNLRNKVMILLMYEATLKRQELIDLKKEDIDFDNLQVTIRNNSGEVDRIGFFTKKTGSMLSEYFDEWEMEVNEINEKRRQAGNYNFIELSEYAFQTIRGYKISYSTIFKAIKDSAFEYYANLGTKLGWSDEEVEKKVHSVDTETLRHSRRAYLFSEGKSVDQVQAIMGDQNQWVTKRYLYFAQKLYPEKFR